MASVLAGVLFQAAPGLEGAQFDVSIYGAKGDAATLCTTAIQKAIDAAASAGGGTVSFSKGIFLTGALFLKSNVELNIPQGVILRAIQDESAYPDIWSRVAGIEMNWPAAVVNVYAQTNVTITGKGTLDGNGEYWWRKFWGTDHRGGMLKDYEARGLRWAVDYDCKRVRALMIYRCSDVKVSGITLERSGFWSLTMTYSEHIKVDGVIIRANIGGYGPSSDGIDIDSSRHVLVQNCDIDANDDNICLKAGRDADGLRVNRPTEDVVIRDCITRAGHGMFTIGSETSGGIRNIEVSGMTALGTATGIRFKSSKVRGGVIENVTVRDVVMKEVDCPFNFEMNWYPAYSLPKLPAGMHLSNAPPHWPVLLQPVPPERGIPQVRNISISNVTATAAGTAFSANGYAEKPLENIRFSNIRVEARTAGRIQHAANWKLENVVISPRDGKGVVLVNCQGVETPTIDAPAAKVGVTDDSAARQEATKPTPTGLGLPNSP